MSFPTFVSWVVLLLGHRWPFEPLSFANPLGICGWTTVPFDGLSHYLLQRLFNLAVPHYALTVWATIFCNPCWIWWLDHAKFVDIFVLCGLRRVWILVANSIVWAIPYSIPGSFPVKPCRIESRISGILPGRVLAFDGLPPDLPDGSACFFAAGVLCQKHLFSKKYRQTKNHVLGNFKFKKIKIRICFEVLLSKSLCTGEGQFAPMLCTVQTALDCVPPP